MKGLKAGIGSDLEYLDIISYNTKMFFKQSTFLEGRFIAK